MRKIALGLAVCLISSAPAFATCKSDAADKKLAGAALKSFMTKCEKDDHLLYRLQGEEARGRGIEKPYEEMRNRRGRDVA